jgi:hypothetical protein
MVNDLNEIFSWPPRRVALCCEGDVGNILKQKSSPRIDQCPGCRE